MVETETIDGAIRVVRISRYSARNALDVATVSSLGAAFRSASKDPAIRVIVLTGHEKVFCVGSDIKEMQKDGLAPLVSEKRVTGWASIEQTTKPVIAAVNGYALGAGFELALMADFIVADVGARFGLPEVKIGVMPGDGGTQRLMRLVGRSVALRMILTGDFFDADRAMQAGFVTDVAEAGGALACAVELAGKIAANAPLAVRMAKKAVDAAGEDALQEGLALESLGLRRLFATSDQKEGMQAFVEKRQPHFKGE
ncbi:MAG: 2,3-dehydroadipyl-CoA hydratase [Fuerstiella sp.]|nr:2,3-dehydroadipyl-CoA hydratase [Fuerstiella sp.]MCP4855139.1 2,3-dehydroadipyl-CoA hydratase [Fuerstiella sp.]